MSQNNLPKVKKLCGTCQHYSWVVSDNLKTTCNNLGSIETTPACHMYSVNPFVLQDFEKVLKPLSDVLRVLPLTVLPMFYEIIAQEKSLRRHGYYFMEKVAVKYFGSASDRYVSNYIIANVFSATDTGVFVIGKAGIRMFVLKGSIIKLSDFLELRKKLIAQNKLTDPKFKGRTSAKQKLAVSETLDDIIDRGVVDELDYGIKRKLNPKRIGSSDMSLDPSDDTRLKKKQKNHLSELSMTTAKKPEVKKPVETKTKGKDKVVAKPVKKVKPMAKVVVPTKQLKSKKVVAGKGVKK